MDTIEDKTAHSAVLNLQRYKTTDDLIVNETKLIEFLEIPNKPDFFGESNIHNAVINIGGTEYLFYDKDRFRLCIYDDYYKTHPDELIDPYNNLMNVCISDYRKRPDTCHLLVKTVYFSNKACDVLIRHMEGIQWNVFAWDEFTQSYLYCIEDRAITFILIFNGIPLTNKPRLSAGPDVDNFNNLIAIFTKKYK